MKKELLWLRFRKLGPFAALMGLLMGLVSLLAVITYTEEHVALLSEARAQAPGLFAALGIGGSSTLLDHTASLLHGFLYPLMGSLLAVHLACKLFPALIETGEMSHYLALPIRRSQLAWTHALTMFFCLLLSALAAMALSLMILTALRPGQINLPWMAALWLGQLCLWILSGGAALMAASGRDEQRGTGGRALALIGCFALIAMLGRAGDVPSFLAWLSPYSLFEPQNLAKGRVGLEFAGMAAISLLCVLIGVRRFATRDLPL